jgi:Tfp pilus assembly protein PilW
MYSPRHANKGSSLVEMLIAIMVLGVVLISMVGMFLISRTAIYNKEDETANALALRYLEELEVKPYSTFTASSPPFSLGSLNASNDKFAASAAVVSADQYSATVAVTINWEAAALGTRNLKLERIISAGGHKNVGELN